MISSISACRCLTHANADLMQAIQIGLEFSLVSCIQSWLITKQRQSFTVSTTSPLPAFPSSATLQHLLAWGIIVDTNTNHVPLAALPALQPLMTFFFQLPPGTCTKSAGARGSQKTGRTTRACTTCQTSSYCGRKGVEERHDDVRNDLLIIHYLPALLMRWRLLNN